MPTTTTNQEASVTVPRVPTTALMAGGVSLRIYDLPEDYGTAWPQVDPTDLRCALGGEPIGAIENDDRPTFHWRTVYAVQITGEVGDREPTLFCEDCYSWLEEVAPTIVAFRAEACS